MSMLDKHLARFAQQCDRVNADEWRLALANGCLLSVSVRRDDGFLLFDAGAGICAAAENVVRMVERSSEFPGMVKPALRGGSCGVRLRAELPMPEENDACASGIRERVEGMRRAMHLLHDEFSREAAGEEMAGPNPQGDGRAIAGSSTERVKESGWPYHERAGGELLVDLESGGQFLQAEVEGRGAGARFRMALYQGEVVGEPAMQAMCLYLLEANAALRYSRAFFARGREGISAGFEVCLDSEPTAGEVGCALGALSVAGRECGREVKVVGGGLAGVYRADIYRATFTGRGVRRFIEAKELER